MYCTERRWGPIRKSPCLCRGPEEVRASFRAVRQRPSQRRHPIASISLVQSRVTLEALMRRVRGLPVLIPYVALSCFRRPGLPEGCPGHR
jgi:hypothetical protein